MEYKTPASLIIAYGSVFDKTFGKDLRVFMGPVTGFDIVAFDEYIGPPEGTSLRDYVLAEYGEGAVALIPSLIGGNTE